MQFVRLGEVVLHYQTIAAPPGRPTVVFINSLGTDFRIWRDVVVRLVGEVGVVLYDKRGHGLSDVGETPFRAEDHAVDLARLIAHLEIERPILCGLSVGGVIAQTLYRDRPELVRAMILCATAHKIGTAEFWNERIAAVEARGIVPIADAVLERWFTAAFRQTEAFVGYRNMLIRQPVAGYTATCGALRDADLTETARRIAVPTICIAGEADGSTPPALVGELAKLIPGSRYELLRNAAHILPVEQPEMLAEIIRAFLPLALAAEHGLDLGARRH